MTDPTDRLIAAWIAWDRNPRAPGTATERLTAMTAAGLPTLQTQLAIARNRARGMSIPDAVQAAINEQRTDSE